MKKRRKSLAEKTIRKKCVLVLICAVFIQVLFFAGCEGEIADTSFQETGMNSKGSNSTENVALDELYPFTLHEDETIPFGDIYYKFDHIKS